MDTTAGTGRRVTGWVLFAGILLMIAGGLNFINGLQALNNKEYFVPNRIIYDNLTFWGWVFVIYGIVQLFAGIAAVGGRISGNYVGVLVAGCAVVLWFFMIFSAPWAALIGVTLNSLVIYGLTAGAEDEWA